MRVDEVWWGTILDAACVWLCALHMCWTHLNVCIIRCKE